MLTQCFLPDFPSLRSKRFCLVSEQKKTEERDFRFWPRGAIFRAVFDSCSSLLAPKPHRNACYAGYDFPQYNSTLAFSLVASRTNNVKQKKTFSRGQGRIFQRYAQFSKYLSRTPNPPPPPITTRFSCFINSACRYLRTFSPLFLQIGWSTNKSQDKATKSSGDIIDIILEARSPCKLRVWMSCPSPSPNGFVTNREGLPASVDRGVLIHADGI